MRDSSRARCTGRESGCEVVVEKEGERGAWIGWEMRSWVSKGRATSQRWVIQEGEGRWAGVAGVETDTAGAVMAVSGESNREDDARSALLGALEFACLSAACNDNKEAVSALACACRWAGVRPLVTTSSAAFLLLLPIPRLARESVPRREAAHRTLSNSCSLKR